MIRFDYQLTQAEFNSASKLFQSIKLGYTPGFAQYIKWAGGSLFVIFVIAILYRVYDGSAHGTAFWELVTFPAILLMVRASTAWTYKRRYGSAPSLRSPHTIEADTETLRMITPEFDGRMKWDVLVNWAENDLVFILVQQGGMIFYPMSKRDVPAATVDAFRHLLQTHVKHHAHQSTKPLAPPPPPPLISN